MKYTLSVLASFWAGGFAALLGVVHSQLQAWGESIRPIDLLNLTIWPYHLVVYVMEVLL